MIFRILKNDLKRKRTMNIVLLLFIILATMFVASGINSVVTVSNGTDYFMDKAGIGDYSIITMGENCLGILDEMLEKEPAVNSYRIEQIVFGEQENIKGENNKKLTAKNTLIFQSIDDSVINFFDKNNQKLSEVEKGYVYVTGSFLKKNKLKTGDSIIIENCGVELSLKIAGNAKDALLGSDMMGNVRFILNDDDIKKLTQNEDIKKNYMGEICYIDTDDVSAMSSAMTKVTNIAFSGPRSLIKLSYVMDMIVAVIMLILSVCLIIVSYVVLKFSITFTIKEEFREIGVMKAIGISNGKIRRLYLIKYVVMAIIRAGIGFFASIPFGNMMLRIVSDKLVLGNSNALMFNAIGVIAVVGIVVLFAYICTGKVKKSSPLDAIRTGQTGERFRKKSILRIGKCPGNNTFFMALNDVLSSPKRFITIIFSFTICTLFVLVLVNSVSTMRSPNLAELFGSKSDLYITSIKETMEDMTLDSRADLLKKFEKMETEFEKNGMPSKIYNEVQYKYPLTFDGKDYFVSCQQGVAVNADKYKYYEGSAPQNEHEIAITPQISEMTGAKIGDTIIIHFKEKDIECMVTAYFQTMNILGEVIRLHEDAPTDFEYVSSMLQYQIDFLDNPSEEEIERRKEKLMEMYDYDEVMNASEYCDSCTSVSELIESVQYLLLLIALVVVCLVTILMERSFISDEKSQIAILKAIGFKNTAIIKWHIYRFAIVGCVSVVLAAVLSIPVTNICITPVFAMMGAIDINYNIEFLKVFLLYPGIVLAANLFVTWLTAIYTRNITSKDTADIE